MKSVKTRNAISLIMNLLLFVLVLISILWFFNPTYLNSGIGNMTTGGTKCFRFFTNDSNILAALTALLVIPYNIRAIRTGKDEIPEWVLTLKMVGTAAVTLTLAVVVVFLGPTQGYARMFSGVCLELHLICPLLAIISFCFFERGMSITKKQLLWALVPTFIYANVYLVSVLITKAWPDFYGFNTGGFWYISYVAVPAFSYLLSLCLRALHNRCDKPVKA